MNRPHHLAWHETLELHELVASKSISIKKFKKSVKHISCPILKSLYLTAIQNSEQHLRELLSFYPYAPDVPSSYREGEKFFYSGALLAASKTAIRNYAVAITETATPALRAVLVKQMCSIIHLHEQVFEYMYQRGYYPSYDLEKLLQNDIKNAQSALNMPY